MLPRIATLLSLLIREDSSVARVLSPGSGPVAFPEVAISRAATSPRRPTRATCSTWYQVPSDFSRPPKASIPSRLRLPISVVVVPASLVRVKKPSASPPASAARSYRRRNMRYQQANVGAGDSAIAHRSTRRKFNTVSPVRYTESSATNPTVVAFSRTAGTDRRYAPTPATNTAAPTPRPIRTGTNRAATAAPRSERAVTASSESTLPATSARS
jgi:hypothetical protein